MKKFVAVIGGLTLASGIALAGDPASQDPASQDQAMIGSETEVKSFNELDENQDGVITQTEASASQEIVAQFQTADANQDGYLTPAEYDALTQETEEAE